MALYNSMRFEKQVAVITGAARGIGLACAQRIKQEGAAAVCCLDVQLPSTDSSDTSYVEHEGLHYYKCNVSCEEQVAKCVSTIEEQHGPISLLVNNAAIFKFGTVEDATVEDWDSIMAVNVKGMMLLTKHVCKSMKKIDSCNSNSDGDSSSSSSCANNKAIVNVASISSFIAQSAFVPYTTTKTAILGLTRACALDLAKYNIRVNAVAPGTIDTPALHEAAKKFGMTFEQIEEKEKKLHILNRIGTAEEVAAAISFLLSAEASFITGTTLRVDGGYTTV